MNRKLKKEIGQRLREFRNSLNFSQGKFAKKLFAERTTYVRNETGEYYPGVDMLHILCKEFDASLDWLICGLGKMLRDADTGQETGGSHHDAGDDVKEMIELMLKVPFVEHSIMCYFKKFSSENKDIIEEELEKCAKRDPG